MPRRGTVQSNPQKDNDHQQDTYHSLVRAGGHGCLGRCRGRIVTRGYWLRLSLCRDSLDAAIRAEGRVLLKGCPAIRTIGLSRRQFQSLQVPVQTRLSGF